MSAEIRLFTVEEANQLAAELRPELERLAEVKREFDRLEERSVVLELAAQGAAPANPDAIQNAHLQTRRRSLAERIGNGIQAIQRHGCLVKDLDRGLVDFYALSGDRLVFLCWHVGEQEVAHWHPLDGGFAGRMPIHRSELE